MGATARTSGILYFLFLLAGVFSFFYVPSKIIVAGNHISTINNIMANQLLFRLGIAGNIIGQIIFIFLVLALYRLFKEVNRPQARLMVALVIASVPVAFMVILNQVATLIFLSGADFLKAFTPQQLQSLAMFFLTCYDHSILIVGIFWGLWLCPFGYLTYKSGFFPKILGVLLMLGCFGYLIDAFTFLIFPAYHAIVSQITTAPASIGELLMIFWLLFKGVKTSEMKSDTKVQR